MDFAAVLSERIEELGLKNVNAAEDRYGFSRGYLRGVLRTDDKRASPSIKKVETICDALGLELHIGPPRDPAGATPPPPADPSEFVQIPVHEASLAAGGGCANTSEVVIDYLSFRRDWLRRIGVAPANAVLARVSGDSMQPTIWADDMVLIDRARREIPVRSKTTTGRSPVYALLDDGHARVKRIERPSADQVMLLSDNPDVGPELAQTQTLSIIGKVVWWGHTSKE